MAMKAKKTPNTYFIMRGNVGLLLQCGFPKHYFSSPMFLPKTLFSFSNVSSQNTLFLFQCCFPKHSFSSPMLVLKTLFLFSNVGSQNSLYFISSSSSSAFSLFGVGASSFQSPRSPVLCFFSRYSCLIHVFSYNITPPQFRSSYLSVSYHFHVPRSHYYIFFSLFLHMS